MVARNEAMNSNLLVAALASFLVTLYLAAVITSNAYWHWLKAKNPSPYDVKKPASVWKALHEYWGSFLSGCSNDDEADDSDEYQNSSELTRTFTVKKKAKACLCNKVTSKNISYTFTLRDYTRGYEAKKKADTWGTGLPWNVAYLSRVVTTACLLVTFALFQPGWVLGRSPADCALHMGADHPIDAEADEGSEFCTTARIVNDTAEIEAIVREMTNHAAAARQVTEMTTYRTRMEEDTAGYHCDGAGAGPVAVEFPDWCEEQQMIDLSRRREECAARMCPDVAQEHCTTVTPPAVTPPALPDACSSFLSIVCASDLITLQPPSLQPPPLPVCLEVAVTRPCTDPCPDLNDIELDSRRLRDGIEQRVRRQFEGSREWLRDRLSTVEVPKEIQETVTRTVSDTLLYLKRRFEIAENLYIFYCISRMWMPTPLVIYKSVCLNDIYRQLFGLTKMAFVWAVILFWWIWDMSTHISDFLGRFELRFYWVNVAVEPCYLDTRFLSERSGAITRVCNEMLNLSQTHLESNYSISSMYQDIELFGPTPLPRGCGCDYPGNRTEIDYFMQSLEPFAGNTSLCTDIVEQTKLLNPPPSSINWKTVWLKSGIVAQLVIKITLVNLAYALLGYTDPLCYYGGKYETWHGGKPMSASMQEDITRLLRWRHRRDILIWESIAVLAISNLLYSGLAELGYSDPTDDLAMDVTDDCARRSAQLWVAVYFFVLAVLTVVGGVVVWQKLQPQAGSEYVNSGLGLFYHIAPDGRCNPYSDEDNAKIVQARSVGKKSLPINTTGPNREPLYFVLRFGDNAVSKKRPQPPASRMIQVNVVNGNTRVVEEEQPGKGGQTPGGGNTPPEQPSEGTPPEYANP